MRFGAQREEPRAVWAIPTDLGCPSSMAPIKQQDVMQNVAGALQDVIPVAVA